MKWIRTKGLIALIVTVSVISVFLALAAGPLIKFVLESQLTSANKAEVNIEELGLSYWPLEMAIIGIQATDKEKPTSNIIEIDKALLAIKTESLLKRKIVITDMQLENIQFATQRKYKGEIELESKVEGQDENSITQAVQNAVASNNSLELPDINSLLEKTELTTPAAYENFENKVEETKKSWQEIDDFLADDEKWSVYKNKYYRLKSEYKNGNTRAKLKSLKKLKELNSQIKKELDVVREQKRKLKDDYEALNLVYKTAKKAPANDFSKLKSSYSLDSANIENITRLIFGDEIANYSHLAKKYYIKLKPYLESDEKKAELEIKRKKGRYINFEDRKPEPGFLIEKSGFTAVLPSGMFHGTALNITSDQSIQNNKTVIELEGKKLKHSKKEEINIVIDVRNKKSTELGFSYDIYERKLTNYKVSGGDTLPLLIEGSTLNLTSDIKLIKNTLAGKAKAKFNAVKFKSTRDVKGNSLPSMIAASLLKVNEFEIVATATGKVLKPKLKIASDIDNKINKQLKARFSQIKKEYESELKEGLKQRFADKTERFENAKSEVDGYNKRLDEKQEKIMGQLNKYKK